MEAKALILIFPLVFVYLRGIILLLMAHVLICFSLFDFNGVLLAGADSATFTFQNRCQYTVWPGILTGVGAQLSSTGFVLSPGGSTSLEIPAPWSGRVWGRTLCSTDSAGKFTCATADCGSNQISCNGAGAAPPVSLIEFTLAADGGKDFYDVSLVDGFNLPLSVTPTGGSGDCEAASCPSNINSACPPELAQKGADGKVIGCKSACVVFNQPQYCCTGEYATPETCKPSVYSRFFKSQCNQAYSYAYDDKTSTFTCSSGPDYGITFCP